MTRDAQSGFVLPFALAVIAVIAVIAAFVGGRIYDAQQTVFRIQTNNDIDRALFSAEAKATFVFLTAPPAPGGFLTSSRPVNEDAYLVGDPPVELDDLDENELWLSTGGRRRDAYEGVDVLISIQDINGLVSLESTEDRILSKFVQSFDISENDADALVAKLRDFTDVDSRRRFRGAERADYRLRAAPPPTNSPLRSLGELKNIDGWRETGLAENIDFLRLATARRTTTRPYSPNMPADLRKRAPIEDWDPDSDDIFAASTAVRGYPSSRARMRLVAVDRNRGLGVERLIEVQRRPDALDVPYERVLVYERPLTPSELREVEFEGVPPILDAAS